MKIVVFVNVVGEMNSEGEKNMPGFRKFLPETGKISVVNRRKTDGVKNNWLNAIYHEKKMEMIAIKMEELEVRTLF